MSYLVLARKYRPGSFDSVSGQAHVTRTLTNAIKRDQVAHAYLFAGPRGVGKTSIARIFAKCLNCVEGPTVSPCLECTNCKEISSGNSLAVREIDGASNNSVDNVRELIESFRTLPAPGSKYKVYIIDEVHMLSISAFNALLKSLEEPPPNTVFILATTEPHKIPDTVLSRCQRHDLRALTFSTIGQRLEEIAKQENFTIEPQAIKMIAKLSEGSMRDAQTLLERVKAYSDESVTADEVSTILGTVNQHVLIQIAQKVLEQDSSAVLQLTDSVFDQGVDETLFLKELVTFFRDLFVVKISSLSNSNNSDVASFGITAEEFQELQTLTADIDAADLSDLADLARTGADKALRSSFPRYALESLLVRMALRPPVRDMGKMVARLREMVGSGAQHSAAPQIQKKKHPEPTAPIRKSVPKETVVKETVANEEASSSKNLELNAFITFMTEQGAAIIAEYIKRLSVDKFADNQFVAKGPAFQIQSLNKKENLQRLRDLICSFGAWSDCKIQLEISKNGKHAEPGSIYQEKQEKLEKDRLDKKTSLVENKSVKEVIKVFPGSKIEKIQVQSR